jgi:hypothetical protein
VRIRAGTMKTADVVRALVDVIECKRALNAFITFDRERALMTARKADARAARNEGRCRFPVSPNDYLVARQFNTL